MGVPGSQSYETLQCPPSARLSPFTLFGSCPSQHQTACSLLPCKRFVCVLSLRALAPSVTLYYKASFSHPLLFRVYTPNYNTP